MGKDKGHLVITDDPNDDIAIRVEGVYKSFRLPHNKQSSLKGSLINLVSRGDRTFETQEVLNDVTFGIKKGEFFGIVGRNGSGKSTLLKMLAGIYAPSTGKIITNGSLTPFIELGVGFNPELTGRENVYMNGALLGFSESEVFEMYDDIVSFAEIERFMDQKLKNYSSGMQVRLAFSIAIRAKSDILLIDEVLAVGDAAFQQKCYAYFDKLKEENRTIVLVTHDMSAVNRFCDRALLIENGKIKAIGKPSKVSNQYTLDNIEAPSKRNDTSRLRLNNGVKKLDIELRKPAYKQSENLVFDIKYELDNANPIDFGISILSQNLSIIEQNTKGIEIDTTPHKELTLTFTIPLRMLNAGQYRIDVAAFDRPSFSLQAFHVDAATLYIKQNGDVRGGILNEVGTWAQK
ncbi:ATP-binding cassette domain-containing protein [Candidatus Saccharibacteria bacterium]|nr:ATP-binding cassette domain-containing protein [Candidatus Saccharibacteria bacterium]